MVLKGLHVEEGVVVVPSRDFTTFTVVVMDVPLFLCPELDESLDYVPFGSCPTLATLIVVDEFGNVESTKADIVNVFC